MKYARALESLSRKPELTSDELDLLSRCYDDGSELIELTDAVRVEPEIPGWRELFRRIKGGDVKASAKPDPARDAQLELMMGAALKAAGARVTFSEPDVRAKWGDHDVVIAAKRVSSRAKLEANIRKARDQIAGVGIPGLIAVDCTVLLPQNDVLHRVPSKADAVPLLDPKVRASIQLVTRRTTEWVQHNKSAAQNVLAVLAYARVRFIYPGVDGVRFGTIRRMRAFEALPFGEHVPDWFRELVLRFNAVPYAPPSS